MESIMYLSTADADGIVRIVREPASPSLAPEAGTPFPQELKTVSPETAEQLAWLLIYDSLREDRRADRVKVHLAELLIWPLLQRKNWVLTHDEIEAAVESIELVQGWLWLDAGYYLDQDPALAWKTGDGSEGHV